MSTICSKLQRIYDDTVHFCFDTAFEYDNNNIKAKDEDSGDNMVGKEDLKPGMYVYYKRGDGHKKTVRTSTLWK